MSISGELLTIIPQTIQVLDIPNEIKVGHLPASCIVAVLRIVRASAHPRVCVCVCSCVRECA